MSVADKIKRCLAGIESLRKEIAALDECASGADALRNLLSARQQQLSEVESRLAQTKKAAAEEDAGLNLWRAVHQKEMAKGNAEIDEMHQKLLDLEAHLTTRQSELKNALDGMNALRSRLGT
jgi:chromosome segregation ATPase